MESVSVTSKCYTAAVAMTNPLLTVQFEIPFAQIRPGHIEPAVDALLADAGARLDRIVDVEGPRTYGNTLAELEHATEPLERTSAIVSHLNGVATSAELRAAYNAVRPKLSEFWSSIPLNEGLYRALRDYAETEEAKGLTDARRRFLDKTLDEFRRHGAALPPEGKEELSAINVDLAQLTNRFSENLLDSTNAHELVVDDESKLAGLPPSARDAARESAKDKGKEGWRFTLQAPSLIAVLTYLDDASVREQMWRAYNGRATEGEWDNRPLIRKILELRRRKAVLLGFGDFADLVLEDRMAKDGETARRFVDELRRRTRPFFDRENEQLLAFRREVEGDPDARMEPWDVGYWAEKQRKALFDFDEEELRPYLAAPRVLEGLFETVRRLYGIRIEERPGVETWDPAVRCFRVLGAAEEHLGSFYVDLHPRENKRGGAWMSGLLTDVPPRPHLGLFAANLTPPVGDEPALLTHREVETIFHEFGHLMHHLLSEVPVRSLGGANVAWDFVELPSQIMENWCWEREALDLFARHHETGEPIPEDLYAKMVRARTYRAANAQMRQLGFAAVDLALHVDFDPSSDAGVVDYARAVLEEHSPTPLPRDYAMIAGFSHLFASPVGYAAGYYSYKWAEVLDADAFTRFREEGVFSPEVGRAFRDAILSKGDSRDPMELYREFMGREPRIEPLLERQGLLGG